MSRLHEASVVLCVLALSATARAHPQPGQPPSGTPGAAPARDTAQTETADLDVGGHLGYANLDELNYVMPVLAADLRLSIFQTAFRIPLRFQIDTGDIREADWDEVGDFFRVSACSRLDVSASGRFEREHGFCQPWAVEHEDYYFTVRAAPLYDFALGHGTIVAHYSNNIDPDHFHPGLVADFQLNRFVTGHFFLDDATNPSLLGGTFALRPFAYLREDAGAQYEQTHQLELGVTAVSDLRAPDRIRTAFGLALATPERNLVYTTAPVTALGGHFHYRYAFGQQIEAEGRIDWNWISEGGMGGHTQLVFIYNHPDGDYSWRGLGEVRYMQESYVPTYFDSYYDIQRQQYTLTDEARQAVDTGDEPFITKLEFLRRLPDGWYGGYRLGLAFEAFTGEGDERRPVFQTRLSVGDNFGRDADGQFVLTAGLTRLGRKIDVFALYSRQSFDTLLDVFQLEDTLVKVFVRWDLNAQFYVLIDYGRIWQLRADADDGVARASGFSSGNDFHISLGFAEGL